MRDRIRSRGVHCFGHMEHGFLKSIYFAGPDVMTLQVATLTGEPMHKWIDPSTVEALGMTKKELEQLRKPTSYDSPTEPVPNAPLEDASPLRTDYPEDAYALMLTLRDEEFREMTLDDVPPAEIPHGSVDYAKVILEKQ